MPYAQPLRALTNQLKPMENVNRKRMENSIQNVVPIKAYSTRQALKRKMTDDNGNEHISKRSMKTLNSERVTVSVSISTGMRSRHHKTDDIKRPLRCVTNARQSKAVSQSRPPSAKAGNRQAKKVHPAVEVKCSSRIRVRGTVSLQTKIATNAATGKSQSKEASKSNSVVRNEAADRKTQKKVSMVSRRVVNWMPVTGDSDAFFTETYEEQAAVIVSDETQDTYVTKRAGITQTFKHSSEQLKVEQYEVEKRILRAVEHPKLDSNLQPKLELKRLEEQKLKPRAWLKPKVEFERVVLPQSTALLVEPKKSEQPQVKEQPTVNLPPGVSDFDRSNRDDPTEVAEYAMDIFKYFKEREVDFLVKPYMHRQPHLTNSIRACIVDWLVQLHEAFELNHETIYLATKIIDIYLTKEIVQKEKIQLIAAAAMLLASKYDEQSAPLISDFLFMCDGAYTEEDILRAEIMIYKALNYDLGIPLSYTFLRRFAKCALVGMKELTTARYILELSLLDHENVSFRESKLATASLHIALKMCNETSWNANIEYYSGYKLSELVPTIRSINESLHRYRAGSVSVKSIHVKYANDIFYEAAKIPLISTDILLMDIHRIVISENNKR